MTFDECEKYLYRISGPPEAYDVLDYWKAEREKMKWLFQLFQKVTYLSVEQIEQLWEAHGRLESVLEEIHDTQTSYLE